MLFYSFEGGQKEKGILVFLQNRCLFFWEIQLKRRGYMEKDRLTENGGKKACFYSGSPQEIGRGFQNRIYSYNGRYTNWSSGFTSDLKVHLNCIPTRQRKKKYALYFIINDTFPWGLIIIEAYILKKSETFKENAWAKKNQKNNMWLRSPDRPLVSNSTTWNCWLNDFLQVT